MCLYLIFKLVLFRSLYADLQVQSFRIYSLRYSAHNATLHPYYIAHVPLRSPYCYYLNNAGNFYIHFLKYSSSFLFLLFWAIHIFPLFILLLVFFYCLHFFALSLSFSLSSIEKSFIFALDFVIFLDIKEKMSGCKLCFH